MVMKLAVKFRLPALPELPPKLFRGLTGWFSVDTAEMAILLEQLRSELPMTRVVLVGKPQTGKSSLVRSLTGVSAEIVGQGFRPHTLHTRRYAYPTDDLPLLVFTDTVGLGETAAETTRVIQELEQELSQTSEPAAKILLLTVKINDFATASLQQIVTSLRRQHPEIPCLLAITCLHEVYPAGTLDHPAYPPSFGELQRAAAAIQAQFTGLVDSTVLVDFTLEGDGYEPVFYGLEVFAEQLSELLPEAEARLINQLLQQGEISTQVGNLYREAGRRYILPFAIMAGTLAAVPLPFATMPLLTSLQMTLVTLLGKLYGQNLTPAQAGGVVSSLAGGFLAQAIGQQLVKFIPGFGSVVAASWAAAYTWALGEASCVYFGDLMGGKTPNATEIKRVMRESFRSAQERFRRTTPWKKPFDPTRDSMDASEIV